MDLRTKDGRSFRKHFSRLRETYPAAAEHALKTLASLQVQIEIAQRDTFGEATYWERARSRTSLLELVRLSRRMERDLEAAKPSTPVEPSAPDLASILARHAPAGAQDVRKPAGGDIAGPGAPNAPSAVSEPREAAE